MKWFRATCYRFPPHGQACGSDFMMFEVLRFVFTGFFRESSRVLAVASPALAPAFISPMPRFHLDPRGAAARKRGAREPWYGHAAGWTRRPQLLGVAALAPASRVAGTTWTCWSTRRPSVNSAELAESREATATASSAGFTKSLYLQPNSGKRGAITVDPHQRA